MFDWRDSIRYSSEQLPYLKYTMPRCIGVTTFFVRFAKEKLAEDNRVLMIGSHWAAIQEFEDIRDLSNLKVINRKDRSYGIDTTILRGINKFDWVLIDTINDDSFETDVLLRTISSNVLWINSEG